jgi:hypothetical protein
MAVNPIKTGFDNVAMESCNHSFTVEAIYGDQTSTVPNVFAIADGAANRVAV